MELKELNDAYLDKVGYLLKVRHLSKYDEKFEVEVAKTILELEEIVDDMKRVLEKMEEKE